MRKILWMAALLTAAQLSGYAQEEAPAEKGFDKSKLFFGGNFGLNFGDLTLINISPQAGYRFSNFFAAGVGINMQYISLKERYLDGSNYSKTAYGAGGLNVFGRIYPIPQVLLQLQPEVNYVFGKIKYYNPPSEITQKSRIVPSLLAGAGITIPSGRSAFIATVMYDVIQDANSPYSTRPFYNFGYNFGF
jgi:hypothetical protein